jgi:aspartoacylase
MNQIKRVAIIGGTHGNELTGVYLIKKFERYPELINRPSLATLTLLGNPQAIETGRRYIDKDLNRCFGYYNLKDSTLVSYEELRAKDIYQMLGTLGKSPVDLIIDLHSTTSNMGLTLILRNKHPFSLQLAAYISSIYPQLRVLLNCQPSRENTVLSSISELGLTIEVGAVAQGVLDADIFQKTEKLIYLILDYLEAYNQGEKRPYHSKLTVYQLLKPIDYPRNEHGEIQAMIHPQIQFQDYKALNPGEPIFLTFEGETITYQGELTVYPVFINEAAYYEKGVAMCLTQKQQIPLEGIKSKVTYTLSS